MNTAGNTSPPDSSLIVPGHGRLRITHVLDPPALRIIGDLDCTTLPVLTRALERIDGSRSIDVDLAGLTFIDVGGLRALVTTAARLDGDQVLTLRAAPVQVRRLLEVTGWHSEHRLRLEDPMPSLKVTLAGWLTRILGLSKQPRPL